MMKESATIHSTTTTTNTTVNAIGSTTQTDNYMMTNTHQNTNETTSRLFSKAVVFSEDHGEEKKETEAMSSSGSLALLPLHGPVQCEMVLDSIDDCVGDCVGTSEQHMFEGGLEQQSARIRAVAKEHGLSEAEATLIRQQIMIDAGTDGALRSAVEETLSSIHPQLDNLLQNVCGGTHDDSLNDLCDGIVLPIDTTLPTSLPGNALVESRQGKSARSLVDIAAEDDFIPEHAAVPTVDNAVQECAICSDCSAGNIGDISALSISSSARNPTFCRLPCCDTTDHDPNFKVCAACMLVLTVATKNGFSRVGRCPRCRTWISIQTLHSTCATIDIRTLDTSGTCETCAQVKEPLISEDPPICDACFLGREVPLVYECEECNQAQTIHSTLYRSQNTSTSFGHEMWPCNTCQKSTHWRIQFDQLPFIPAGDVPEEWGDDFLELARARVQKARQGIAKLDLPGRDARGQQAKEDGCAIM